jgi:hypothetical protein
MMWGSTWALGIPVFDNGAWFRDGDDDDDDDDDDVLLLHAGVVDLCTSQICSSEW